MNVSMPALLSYQIPRTGVLVSVYSLAQDFLTDAIFGLLVERIVWYSFNISYRLRISTYNLMSIYREIQGITRILLLLSE